MNLYESFKKNLNEANTKSNKYVDAYMGLSESIFDGLDSMNDWVDWAENLADEYNLKQNTHDLWDSTKTVKAGMSIMYEKEPEKFKDYVESLIIDVCVNDGYFDYLDSKSHKERDIIKNLQILSEYLQNNRGSQEAIDAITTELENLSNVQVNARQVGEAFNKYMNDNSFWSIMGTNCRCWTNKDLERLPKEYACFTGADFNFLLYDKWTKDDGTENEYGLGYGFKNSGNIVVADLLTYKTIEVGKSGIEYDNFTTVGNSFEITPENTDKAFAQMRKVFITTANELKKKNRLSYNMFVKRWRDGKYGAKSRDDYNKHYKDLGIKESNANLKESKKDPDYLDDEMLNDFVNDYYKFQEEPRKWSKKEMRDWIISNKENNPNTKIDLIHLDNLLDFQHDLYKQDQEELNESDEFIINKTPFGFTEVVYKGYYISNMGGNITVNIAGDDVYFDSIEDAISEIDSLSNDSEFSYPDYSIDDEFNRITDEHKKVSKDNIKWDVERTTDRDKVKNALSESYYIDMPKHKPIKVNDYAHEEEPKKGTYLVLVDLHAPEPLVSVDCYDTVETEEEAINMVRELKAKGQDAYYKRNTGLVDEPVHTVED